MKLSSILLLVGIAVAAVVLVSVAGDFGTYSSFKEVMANPSERHQIVGHLSMDKDPEYNPTQNPNLFSFYMKDEHGIEKKVIYQGPKPQDFERSEQIVLTGKLEGNDFVATEMLLKCPSKYKDQSTFKSASVN
jgi:cytochrome c-type biogenesis protein CcmE